MKYLIVVDMQNDFVSGSLGSEDAERIVPAVCEKIKAYLNQESRIFVTLDTHGENYLSTSEGKNLPVVHCVKETNGWELENRVKTALNGQGEYYEKNTFGSVRLAKHLSEIVKDGDSIELCGLCTDICVVTNALMIKAFCPETEVIVSADCCAGATKEKHLAAIETMKSCQIKIK